MKSIKFVFNVFAITGLYFLIACGDSSSSSSGTDNLNSNDNNPTNFNELQLVTHLTNNIITPRFESFNIKSGELQSIVKSYCDIEKLFNAGDSSESARDSEREQAQSRWRQAMADWQVIEVMQLGPLTSNRGVLKSRIYSWPLTSTCGVDQDVVFFNLGDINGTPYNLANRIDTRRGLDALEYLLFNNDLNHTCTTVEPQGWDSLSAIEKREQRCEFAYEVANDIKMSAQQLVDEWSGLNGYAQSLLNADNEPGDDFENLHQAVNRISDGLFYVDTETKSRKLAVPAGIDANSCGQNPCPENLESEFALNSLANIRNNLVGLKVIFTGEVENQTETIGFDDYLISEGEQTLSDEIVQAIDAAIADIDNYQESLASVLETNASQVVTTHEKVRDITSSLKEDFITKLSLTLPSSSAGDND